MPIKELSLLSLFVWCDFDRASSLICGNKMPTRCNRGFYCRSYCLLGICTKYHRQQSLYNTLELLMMGIVVPKTCVQAIRSAIKTSVASSWHFISTYYMSLFISKVKNNITCNHKAINWTDTFNINSHLYIYIYIICYSFCTFIHRTTKYYCCMKLSAQNNRKINLFYCTTLCTF